MPYKPGDAVTFSREAKVFLTQYQSVSAFVSLTRTLGDDPETEVAAMHEQLDRMWYEALKRNFALLNDAYAALGTPPSEEALIAYLHAKAPDADQAPSQVQGHAAQGSAHAAPGKGAVPSGAKRKLKPGG